MTQPSPETLHEIARIIAEVIGSPLNLSRAAAAIRPEDALSCDLALDSLHRQSLACECDEHFRVEIPDRDVMAWQTVADVAASVEARRRATAFAKDDTPC